jgi:hypothetical protein
MAFEKKAWSKNKTKQNSQGLGIFLANLNFLMSFKEI